MPAEWAFFGGTRCAYSPSYTLEALWIIIRLLRLFAFVPTVLCCVVGNGFVSATHINSPAPFTCVLMYLEW